MRGKNDLVLASRVNVGRLFRGLVGYILLMLPTALIWLFVSRSVGIYMSAQGINFATFVLCILGTLPGLICYLAWFLSNAMRKAVNNAERPGALVMIVISTLSTLGLVILTLYLAQIAGALTPFIIVAGVNAAIASSVVFIALKPNSK